MKKILLALYILYLPFQLKLPQIPLVNTTNAFLFFLAIVWIFNKNKSAARPAFETPLLIFLFIWALSFLHTVFSPGNIWVWEISTLFKRIFTLVLGYFVFARCVNTKKERQFLFYVFLLSIVLVALYTWKSGVLAGPHFGDHKRSSGPFAEGWHGSDIAGGFLATFTPFLISFALLAEKKILKFPALLGVLICVFGTFATYSRGAIIALTVSFVLTMLLAMPRLMRKSKGFGILILVVMIFAAIGWRHWVPQSVISRIDKTFQAEKDVYGIDSTITFDQGSERRQEIWEMGLEVFYSSPIFGLGFRRPEYELSVDPHNSFILIGSEMGIIGLWAFVWLLWRILMAAKALLKTEYLDLGIGFIGCLTALIIVNCFYSNFFRDTVVGTFWIILGLLAASKSLLRKST